MSQPVTGNAFDIGLLKRILTYVKPYKKRFYFTGVLTLILAFFAPLRPLLIQYSIDKAVIIPNKLLLFNLTALMVFLLFLETFIQFYQTYLANWLGQTVIKDLRVKVFKKITSFKLKYFDSTPIGTLVT